ncbi:acetyltransferase, ribosomal protein N-acetylase [Aequorivita sublithincola DSM 14238]|uniref:Acetyltransferase, ribosomal protein N-acetylase n=1 Tax=Aequorivita sublithincola (strain DSM 14238 / LMG 21431 / ACAM 643 / 9-3) TaxID=746697 RepID=I3YRY7_AEQSU|nr:GNAT family N-acetyltransferase [Aequorivita sublithincola]AFL79755.1 acetyltransferase, ribosomal protein N-acetylase [Aequorivita sublithincola DSM 14238]
METFNFLQEHILENDAVRLNPMHHQDIDKLIHFSEQQPDLWKYSLQPADGLENLKTYMGHALRGRKEETSYPFIVFDKHTQQIAGSTRFYDYQKTHNTIQLGYTWYGEEFQGIGLNKQCKILMLEFAFEKLGIERVEFRADANNARSIAAMKSLGCTVEGILRSNCAALEGRRDSIILSILKGEWFGGVKETLLLRLSSVT